jgi:membrane protein implicated in regulation of membrane protease activity
MLFFTMIVLWLVFYIWLMTEHLSDLSNTVLLLMGIAGVGATAAAGADVAKNRLSLDNWAWLVNAKWLPQGGIAAVTKPRWRDIFTANGEFDVPRFQLITFSFVVGCALLASGADLADLSKFSIPQQLLSILGLSQVVYVAGKLVAPPTMADLDAQLTKMREAQGKLAAATADVARANVATAAADQKALDDAKAASKTAEDVARVAFVSVYQIAPGQYF